MPNEAFEYLQGRTTPPTKYVFSPKQYSSKPRVENAADVLIENLPSFEEILERRIAFRTSVSVEAAKVHPLEKKAKKRRKFRIFSTKRSTQHIARRYLPEGSGSGDAFTRKPSIVLHVREEPARSGSRTTVLKRWLSSDALTERRVGSRSMCRVTAHDDCTCPVDESPTSRKKWRERVRSWFSGKQ